MARHRVQVLRAGGKTQRRIATETGIPLRTVKRIVREPTIAMPGAWRAHRSAAWAAERGRGVSRPDRGRARG